MISGIKKVNKGVVEFNDGLSYAMQISILLPD